MLQDADGQSISLLIGNLYTSKQLLQHFLQCIWVNLVNFRVKGISRTLLALWLHSRTPSSCSARWMLKTCKPYWPRNSINVACSKQCTHSLPLDFKYSLWTSSSDVNNKVGCLGSGCLQRRWAGDEKQWIILEWPYVPIVWMFRTLQFANSC